MAKNRKFIDRVQIDVTAGNGGNGSASFRREKFVPKGGPDGGDGGRGGHVYLQADINVDSLVALYFRPIQKAEHGGPGRRKQMHGKNGDDLYLKVPMGTECYDLESETFLGEVLGEDNNLMVARGGKGGLGNVHFKSSINRAPTKCTPGKEGEHRHLRLLLKMISDAGLIGYPNAGKSTLLTALSEAHPKIAAYPFTTINPIIGTLNFDDYKAIKVADIPGLIDGAHEGVGLGYDFLRHIERTSFLIFVLDMAGVDGRDPSDDYMNLRKELQLYRSDLMARPYMILANKMDEPAAEEHYRNFVSRCGEVPVKLSAALGDGVESVIKKLHQHFFEKSV